MLLRLASGLPVVLVLEDGRPEVLDECLPMIGVFTKPGVGIVWTSLLTFEVEFILASLGVAAGRTFALAVAKDFHLLSLNFPACSRIDLYIS